MGFRGTAIAFAVGACACTSPSTPVETGDARVSETDVVHLSGKEDNFLSPVSREYKLETTVRFTVNSPNQEVGQYEAEDWATRRIEALTEALDERIWALWDREQRRGETSFLLRTRSGSQTRVTRVRGSEYEFTFRIDAVGPNDLFSWFPFESDEDGRFITVTVGETSHRFGVRVNDDSTDSYPDYLSMFEDGLDIAIHIGDDHNTDDVDISQARDTYAALTGEFGLASPVDTFSDLGLDSGPFTGFILVEDQFVDVRVSLFHADMVDDENIEALVDAYKESATFADVVYYNGHAGRTLNYSGVVLHYNERAALPATEFRNLVTPDHYQLYVFAGCNTYTGYADELYAHPERDEFNTDIITTGNFTTYRRTTPGVGGFLRAVLRPEQAVWTPRTWTQLLTEMHESDGAGPWPGMYGVHGLDDNDPLSPLADLDTFAQSCNSSSDCPGADSFCVGFGDRRACSVACADDSACPSGSSCLSLSLESIGDVGQCL